MVHHTSAAAKSLQSCPTMCGPIDRSPPGSPTPGILQARTLEWVDISFSNAWKWKVKVNLLSNVWILETIWTVAYHAPPSMGFSRQEYWSGVTLPSPTIHLHIFIYLLNFWVYGTLLLTMYTLLYIKSVELFHLAWLKPYTHWATILQFFLLIVLGNHNYIFCFHGFD